MQISVYKDPYFQSYQKSKSLGNDSGVINSINQSITKSKSNSDSKLNTNSETFSNVSAKLQSEKNNVTDKVAKSISNESDLKLNLEKIQNNPNLLLNNKERDFFKSLFPESAEQIEKHKVFNRNAKVQTQSINKGLIFDSRI